MLLSLVQKMEWALLLVLLLTAVGKGDKEGQGGQEGEEEPLGVDGEAKDPEAAADQAAENLPEGMQALRFKAAKLSEEDQHSMHMPLELMCDGCRIIAYIATKSLKRIQDRYKKGHRLLESDIIDILDGVCNDKKQFDSYGIKEVKGKKRLSGEGLETKDEPGMMQGGGKWPSRLRQMCEQYVGNLGEDFIYDIFLQEASLERLFCYSDENGNICSPQQNKTKKSKEEL